MSNVDKKGATEPTVLTGFVSKALLPKKKEVETVVVKDTSDAERIAELEAQLAALMETQSKPTSTRTKKDTTEE
jgi:hypothetical protein